MSSYDLSAMWDRHTADEFQTRDTEATLATMVDDAYVNHVPVMTGGQGKAELRRFYSHDFIPMMPPDTTLQPISRTIGENTLVDEMIFSFTHSIEMPWMLPGVPPTNKKVHIPLVVIVGFRDGIARSRTHLLGFSAQSWREGPSWQSSSLSAPARAQNDHG
jgi:carboxymethylenebutenolidase